MLCPRIRATEMTTGKASHHPNPSSLSFLLAGGACIRSDGRELACDTGAVLICPPGRELSIEGRAHLLFVDIQNSFFESLDACAGGLLQTLLVFAAGELGNYPRRLQAEWRRIDASPLSIEAAVLALIGRAVEVLRDRLLSKRFSVAPSSSRNAALEARLASARDALLSTNAGIADIASRTGFFDHAHLTRMFRKRFGATPSEYRRVNR